MATQDMILLIEVDELPSMHKVGTFGEIISIIHKVVGTDKKKIIQAVRDGKIAIYKRDKSKDLRIKARFL